MAASKVAPPHISMEWIAHLVHLFRHGEHVGEGQTGGHDRLVAVAKNRLGNAQLSPYLRSSLCGSGTIPPCAFFLGLQWSLLHCPISFFLPFATEENPPGFSSVVRFQSAMAAICR